MREAAAEAIGANPIECRVAAYYHDIGKVQNPLYFIENIMDGPNPHDELTPSMSARIIIDHVSDGVKWPGPTTCRGLWWMPSNSTTAHPWHTSSTGKPLQYRDEILSRVESGLASR